jgi:hypothetical protein
MKQVPTFGTKSCDIVLSWAGSWAVIFVVVSVTQNISTLNKIMGVFSAHLPPKLKEGAFPLVSCTTVPKIKIRHFFTKYSHDQII